jgi:hypothetical protein
MSVLVVYKQSCEIIQPRSVLLYFIVCFVFQQISRANSLQHLNIGGTFVTDESLFAIADSCPRLKVRFLLTLPRCPFWTPMSANICPRFRCFHVIFLVGLGYFGLLAKKI